MAGTERELLPEERIVYAGRLHGIVLLWPALLTVLCAPMLLGLGVALVAAGPLGTLGTVELPMLLLLALPPLALGLTWLNWRRAEFVVTTSRVILRSGILRRRSVELQLRKVESVAIDQSPLGRLLGYGTLTVSGTGGSRERFQPIAQPHAFRLEVQRQIAAVAAGAAGAASAERADRAPPELRAPA